MHDALRKLLIRKTYPTTTVTKPRKMEELEAQISRLRRELLDRHGVILARDRRILELEDENLSLKRDLRRLREGSSVSGGSETTAVVSRVGEVGKVGEVNGATSDTAGVTVVEAVEAAEAVEKTAITTSVKETAIVEDTVEDSAKSIVSETATATTASTAPTSPTAPPTATTTVVSETATTFPTTSVDPVAHPAITDKRAAPKTPQVELAGSDVSGVAATTIPGATTTTPTSTVTGNATLFLVPASVEASQPPPPARTATSPPPPPPKVFTDPIRDYGESDQEDDFDDLLNGGGYMETTPPPGPSASASQSVQVMGTPEKVRKEAKDLQTRLERQQAGGAISATGELVLEPVKTRIKAEPDTGAFARAMIAKKAPPVVKEKPPKASHKSRSSELGNSLAKERAAEAQLRLERKALEVSINRADKDKDKNLIKKFFKNGRQEKERAVTQDPEEDGEQPPMDFDQYELSGARVTGKSGSQTTRADGEDGGNENKDYCRTTNFFLRTRFLSEREKAVLNEGQKVMTVTDCLRKARDGTTIDYPSFAVYGVIVHKHVKSFRNKDGSTSKVVNLRLSDRKNIEEEWGVMLTCKSDAFELCWKWPIGAIVCVVNPALRQFTVTDKDTGVAKEETGLVINSGDMNLAFEVGMTADVGSCKATTLAGSRCKRAIYRRKLNLCIQHKAKQDKLDKQAAGKGGGSSTKGGLDQFRSNAPGKEPNYNTMANSSRAEFNSVVTPNFVKGTGSTVSISKPPPGQAQSRSFVRQSQEEKLRQKRDHDRILEQKLQSNPQSATMFGRESETEVPSSSKFMSSEVKRSIGYDPYRKPDQPKVPEYKGDKRMSDYVMEKPRKRQKAAVPKGPAAMVSAHFNTVSKPTSAAATTEPIDLDSDSDFEII